MPRLIGVIAFSAVFFLLAGCGLQPSASKSDEHAPDAKGVAVVDLDAVAKRIGRDVEIAKSLEQKQTALNERLAAIQESVRSQYKEKKEKAGDKPTDEQQKELRALEQDLGLSVKRHMGEAQKNIALFRQQLVNRFREQVRPVARDVAEQKGFDIVVLKDESLLFVVEEHAEITDAVIERMLAANTSTPAVKSDAALPPKADRQPKESPAAASGN